MEDHSPSPMGSHNALSNIASLPHRGHSHLSPKRRRVDSHFRLKSETRGLEEVEKRSGRRREMPLEGNTPAIANNFMCSPGRLVPGGTRRPSE